jgi:hypothetical protein
MVCRFPFHYFHFFHANRTEQVYRIAPPSQITVRHYRRTTIAVFFATVYCTAIEVWSNGCQNPSTNHGAIDSHRQTGHGAMLELCRCRADDNRRILLTANDRLRPQRRSILRTAADCNRHQRIMSQTVEVDRILVAARDRRERLYCGFVALDGWAGRKGAAYRGSLRLWRCVECTRQIERYRFTI